MIKKSKIYSAVSDNHGFTLVEFLVYIGITSILVTIVTLVGVSSAGIRTKVLTQHETNYAARFAMDRITQEIRRASAINTSTSTFGSSPGTLSLQMDDATQDPTIIDVSGGALRITRGSGSAVKITPDNVTVSNFVVKNRSRGTKAKNIRVEMTVDYNNPSNLKQYDATITLKSTVSVRKKDL